MRLDHHVWVILFATGGILSAQSVTPVSLSINTDGTTPWTISVGGTSVTSGTPYLIGYGQNGFNRALSATSNGNSNGTLVGGGPESNFDGFYALTFRFNLPSSATNVQLSFQNLFCDDRCVFELNGTIIGDGAGGPGSGFMTLTDGGPNNPYNFSGTKSGLITSGFNVGGPNAVTMIVNNTHAGIGGSPANVTPSDYTAGFVQGSITFDAGPAPTVTSVVNAFNAQSALSAGTVAIVTGTNFGTVASNLSVVVGGKAAYVYPATVTAQQFEIEIPMGLTAGPTTLTVTVSSVPSEPFNLTLVAYAPTCESQDSSGSGLGTITNSGGNLVTLTSPAQVGNQLSIVCTGLGPTTPATATGLASAANATATPATMTIGSVNTPVGSATVMPGKAGVYQINFTVPPGAQGTQPLVVIIGGASSPTQLTIALAGLSSVVNNASFANPGTASPGSIVSAFANGLGTTTDVLTKLFPSTSSEGVGLTFNGEAAPMFHIVASGAQQQVDLLVPADLPTSGAVNVRLNSYLNYTLTMVPANPGIYRIHDPQVPSRFNVIAQFANTTWLALPASTTAALGLPACTPATSALTVCGQPATARDYLVLYVTGLGLATPNGDPKGNPLSTGQVAPADASVLYETPTLPAVTVGGVAANVLFSGLSPGFAGLYQIDLQVPDGVASGDDVAVKVTLLGASDTATISIQPRVGP